MNLEAIWSEYRVNLKDFLHSKISNEADVEDLLQEILIKTHKNIDSIRQDHSIKSWLFQIANRTVIDFYRKRGKQTDIESDAPWYEKPEADLKSELSHCITPFLNELDQEAADLLRATDLGEQSQKAYAEKLGIPYTTMKSRVQKARMNLKALFDECCHFQLDKSGNLIEYDRKSGSCTNC